MNLSTRCVVGVGDEVAIAGTIVGDPNGTNNAEMPKRRVLMFGKGPSLSSQGVPDPLTNPQLSLSGYVRPGTPTSNQSWRTIDGSRDALEEELANVGDGGIQPASELESALWPALEPGESYTAILSGENGTQGIGLLEFYEF